MTPISPGGVPVLECRGVVKRYGPLLAVDTVDLSVTAGEVVGLVGKNGAGKSSLIKVLTGAVQPDSGQLLMSGEEVSFRGPGDSRSRGVGCVHQELNLIEQATIAENIALGGGYPHSPVGLVNWRGLHARAQELMDAVDIGHVHPRTPVSALTAVQRRQVMIASALWHIPKVLILDEPTASLSEHEVVILHGIVKRLQERGTAIIYVSHRLDEVIGITDRVVVMRDGAVVEEERTEALDKPRLVEMITGGAVPTEPPLRGDAGSGEVVLRVDGVTSDKSPHPASFEVRAGEILGLAGLVGSGRSELLRAIYGADDRRSGEVTVFGEAVPDRPAASLRAGLAFLSEDRLHAGLVTGFSIGRNITFASMDRFRVSSWLPVPSRRRERDEARSKVAELSVKASSVDQPVLSLSGGNQQKVLMARWLATEPRVLLLDEPTLGIDVEAKAEIYDLLRKLAARGFALVVVSSEFPELELLCTRALVMREGRIVAELEGRSVTEANLLHHCFDARVEA
ncbi:sugar ABC transporter ATP-binding protein [Nocardioides caldifontis]|uniref:sugar ABC transporter ATP-binding protein n=1 Tax=Nocardioides caldifontis TaxID=2588938 RepID=UPI001396915C|nr:sugar ABC transporter ATP-binding protein [Nocardioides caldifontis]